MCTYVRTLPEFTTAIQSGNETTQKLKLCLTLQLRMVRPWPDQPDRFWCLCIDSKSMMLELTFMQGDNNNVAFFDMKILHPNAQSYHYTST